MSEAVGEEITPETPVETLRAIAERHDVGVDPAWIPGKVVEELFEALVQHTLQAPTFVIDYPLDTSPLTRAHRSQPGLAEKWDLYIGGIERATAYSELVDPVAQRERFTAQAVLAAAGDPEAMALDEDFLEALEYGMPPTGGMGMGMDRLMMTLTGLGIRETILFPLVRPHLRSLRNRVGLVSPQRSCRAHGIGRMVRRLVMQWRRRPDGRQFRSAPGPLRRSEEP